MMMDNFAAEVRAQATRALYQARYCLRYQIASGDFYEFMVRPGTQTYQFWSSRIRLVESKPSSVIKPLGAASLLRIEVVGDTLRGFVNGEQVGQKQIEGLDRRGGLVGLAVQLADPPGGGDVEVRFTDFRVYTWTP
jgi:hypothetical protein